MSKRDFRLYFEDILESTKKIEGYIANLTYDDFVKDNKTIDAVVRNLETIGEAAKQIDEETKKKYDDIPWREIVDFRNRIIHGYFVIDYEIIWQIISKDLPDLKQKVEKAIELYLKRKKKGTFLYVSKETVVEEDKETGDKKLVTKVYNPYKKEER